MLGEEINSDGQRKDPQNGEKLVGRKNQLLEKEEITFYSLTEFLLSLRAGNAFFGDRKKRHGRGRGWGGPRPLPDLGRKQVSENTGG